MNEQQFRSLLAQVADGWSNGDPGRAADAYAEDGVYVEPPDRQRYVGRAQLFEFFHGPGPEPRPMRMTWHVMAFDAERQAGFAEYTFQRPGLQLHGIVAVTVDSSRIASWREYQYSSDLSFDDFAGDSLRFRSAQRSVTVHESRVWRDDERSKHHRTCPSTGPPGS